MQDIKTASKTLAAVYIRVSTEKQEKWSPDAQRLALSEHCLRMGWDPLFYSETGSGETLEGRPEMMRLLRDARSGRFSVCLAIEMTRLSRDRELFDWLTIKQVFRGAGVKIATPSQTYDLRSAEDDFLTNLFGSLSAREKQIMLERTKRGRQAAYRKGLTMGEWMPYGYRTLDRRIVKDPVEAEVVSLILSMAETKSSRCIARELEKRGIPTRHKKQWRGSSIIHILRNPVLHGEFEVGEQVISVDPYLTLPEWKAIQVALSGRAVSPRYEREHKYLLAGMLICGACGRRMYARTEMRPKKPTKEYGYYRCAGRARDLHLCDSPTQRREPVEAVVWEEFKTYLKSPRLIYDAVTLAYEEQDQLALAKADDLAQTKRSLDALTREETALIRAFYGSRAGLTQESFSVAVEEIAREKKLLAERLREIESTGIPTAAELASLPTLKAACEVFSHEIDQWDWQMKKEALSLLVESVTVHADCHLTIRCKIPAIRAPERLPNLFSGAGREKPGTVRIVLSGS